MQFLSQYTTVFLDFDGLLVNTEQLHFEAYKQLVESRDLPFPIDFHTFAGMAHTSSEALRAYLLETYPLLRETPWPELYAEKQSTFLEILASGPLDFMPGADALVSMLAEQNKPMCVVTNSSKALIDACRQRLPKLSLIPYWITRECYDAPKPKPDAYNAALKALNVKPHEVVGFEDSLRGIHALQGAQIDPVLICDPAHPQMSSPEVASLKVFSTFIQLLEEIPAQ